ncbi:N-formylglutamate amidohydrolase [Wenzhouxiangella sediminis]|uniref:N-formylglutamate amidohydrolase n=1 Tax=Wenzhouxiangella sediminis TaxID=1792836 RepID=A0A3E1KCM5_9GAMM|nr:N-formylglutamate amidohydrolase [Wenzhouxiangella sediminis]RFF32712.1 N-formylglutamate amidohydrolase [Wenzhouxiangella sediminis]
MPGSKPPVRVLITCEHASRRIPGRFAQFFAGSESKLTGHRGWDPGTAELGRALARRLDAPLLAGRASRLLIDLNRSASHPHRFSEFTRGLPPGERERIERDWWLPHWRAYREFVEGAAGRVVHIACHSFTPVLEGRERRVDIGLLYDPSRAPEKRLCRRLAAQISSRLPDLRVRMNVPYRGTANGLGQQHRRVFGPDRLVTIELEVNQALVDAEDWPGTKAGLVEAVAAALADSD